MTKKVKISFLILVWGIVVIQCSINDRERLADEEKAVTAFSVVADEDAQKQIAGYGFFGAMELSEEMKERLLESIAQKLGISEDYSFYGDEGEGYEKLALLKNGKYATTTIQIITLLEDARENQYISIQVKTDQSVPKSLALYRKIQKLYREIGIKAQVEFEYDAEEVGNQLDQSQVVKNFLQQIDANVIDTVDISGSHILYGYTALEKGSIKLRGKKTNIQVVEDYDETENITRIKIGLPIVNSAY